MDPLDPDVPESHALTDVYGLQSAAATLITTNPEAQTQGFPLDEMHHAVTLIFDDITDQIDTEDASGTAAPEYPGHGLAIKDGDGILIIGAHRDPRLPSLRDRLTGCRFPSSWLGLQLPVPPDGYAGFVCTHGALWELTDEIRCVTLQTAGAIPEQIELPARAIRQLEGDVSLLVGARHVEEDSRHLRSWQVAIILSIARCNACELHCKSRSLHPD